MKEHHSSDYHFQNELRYNLYKLWPLISTNSPKKQIVFYKGKSKTVKIVADRQKHLRRRKHQLDFQCASEVITRNAREIKQSNMIGVKSTIESQETLKRSVSRLII